MADRTQHAPAEHQASQPATSHLARRDFFRLSAAGAVLKLGHIAESRGRSWLPIPRNPVMVRQRAQLADVNTTSIRAAVELGCQTMSRTFNADDHEVGAPFFWINLRPVVQMHFANNFSDAQVPGKSLLGLVTAEKLLGVSVDPAVIDRYARVLFYSYSGPVALPLNRDAIGGKLVNFFPVNIAHGFHGLYALTAFKGSDRAREVAESSIAAVSSLWDPKKGWDRIHLERTLGLKYGDVQPDAPFVAGLAMAIGPLAKYYRATGSRAALDLASQLKEKVLAECFLQSGEYDPALLGAHVQNVVYVMASLAWLATVTRDESLIKRVKAFYDNGLKRIRNGIGWSPEFFGAPAHLRGPRGTNADRGEAGNTALILETALLLGDWGYPGAFADAELMLRSHLLPSQFRDVSFIPQPPNPQGLDGLADIARRAQGSWGFPAPYGHQPLGDNIVGIGTDIVGPVVYALAEAHSRVVGRQDGNLAIHLLFDYKDDDIEISSPYSGNALTVAVRKPQSVMVRIPPWVSTDRIELIGASRQVGDLANGYLRVSPTGSGRFAVRFPLPLRKLDVSYDGRTLRSRAHGDQVVAMDNRGADLGFFAPYSE